MGGRAVNLDEHLLALLAAKGDVVSGRAAASWALFAYEKSNVLKLLDSGAGGPDELAKRLQSGSVMYGLCRLPDAATGRAHVILISWVGEGVPEQQREECAGHLPAIRAFFKEAALVVAASRAGEVAQEGLRRTVALRALPRGGSGGKQAQPGDPQERVGTSYRKTNPALELLRSKRGSFWAQAEREEEERREAERRQAQDERRRWELQRMEAELREAAERERRVQAREQQIEAWRKQQAAREAEERRREEARRQEAGELLAPRDDPQQRERSGSAGGASEPPSPVQGWPGAPRRPFLRHQRSLTESAYIFRHQHPAPPGSSPGGFLPAASPCPPQPPAPPATDPGPGAPASPPTPEPVGSPPSVSPPSRAGGLLPAPPLEKGASPGAREHPSGLQEPLPSTSGLVCSREQQTAQGPPEAPPGSLPGPPGASPMIVLLHPPTEPPQPGASPGPSPCSPLAAPGEEACPPTGSTDPSCGPGPDHPRGLSHSSPLQSAPPPEEGPARGRFGC